MRSKFVAISLVVHLSVFFALETAALKPEKPRLKNVEMALLKKPPPPPEPLAPEPPKPVEKKKVLDLTKKVVEVKPPDNAPPPKPNEPPPPPVFGVSLSSTTQDGSGMNVRVGNTTMTEPGKRVDPKDVKPLTAERAPVSVAQVSKKPQVAGSCPPFEPSRLYTQEAKDQEIEGRVELEVTIGEDGSVRDVKVKRGLGHGLDEAAVSMMKQHCKFTPAEIDGEKVPTKINYTVTFALPD